jgi:hypothetical protein
MRISGRKALVPAIAGLLFLALPPPLTPHPWARASTTPSWTS